MKKMLLFFTVGAMSILSGCEGPEGPQGQTGEPGTTTTVVGETYEMQGVNFTFDNTTSEWKISRNFTDFVNGHTNFDSDVVLIYRLSGTVNPTTPIWQQIPRTLFLAGGAQELDYDFDFTFSDFVIYAGGNYDISTTPQYLNNQTFRIVVVPSDFVNKVNTADYNQVREKLKLKDSDFKKI